MSIAFRLLAVLLCGMLALTACSPSSDKSSKVKTAVAPHAAQGALMPDQYDVLTVSQPTEAGNKVEVLEFFAYFCSHCREMDPQFHQWAKKNADIVVFKRVPVAFREDMAAQQRMYYALEAMGQLDALHGKIFQVVQDEGNSLGSDQDIFEFVASQGIDVQKFKDVYASFGIQSKARNAALLQKAYKIEGVPSVAVDGRFMTSASHASKRPGVGTLEEAYRATFEVMDDLVEKVRRDRASVSAAAKK